MLRPHANIVLGKNIKPCYAVDTIESNCYQCFIELYGLDEDEDTSFWFFVAHSHPQIQCLKHPIYKPTDHVLSDTKSLVLCSDGNIEVWDHGPDPQGSCCLSASVVNGYMTCFEGDIASLSINHNGPQFLVTCTVNNDILEDGQRWVIEDQLCRKKLDILLLGSIFRNKEAILSGTRTSKIFISSIHPGIPFKTLPPTFDEALMSQTHVNIIYELPCRNGEILVQGQIVCYRGLEKVKCRELMFSIDGANCVEVEELAPGEVYYFSIKFRNNHGWGLESGHSARCQMKAGPPDIILKALVVHKTATSMEIEWMIPFNGGSEITFYLVEVMGGKEKQTTQVRIDAETREMGSTLRYVRTNLLPQYTYKFRVNAENCNGAGRFSPWTTSEETSVHADITLSKTVQ